MMKRLRYTGFLLVLLVAGCVNIPRDTVEVRRYAIDPPPYIEKADTSFQLTVFVQPFQANAAQRGERVIYRDDKGSTNYYFYHRWVASPEKMIGDAFANSLSRWGLFRGGVFQSETGIIPTHEIQGRLIGLWANNIRNQYSTFLEIKISVLRVDPETYEKTLVFQRSYPIIKERQSGSVESHILAVNEAMDDYFLLVRDDLKHVFKQEARWRLEQTLPPLIPLPKAAFQNKTGGRSLEELLPTIVEPVMFSEPDTVDSPLLDEEMDTVKWKGKFKKGAKPSIVPKSAREEKKPETPPMLFPLESKPQQPDSSAVKPREPATAPPDTSKQKQ